MHVNFIFFKYWFRNVKYNKFHVNPSCWWKFHLNTHSFKTSVMAIVHSSQAFRYLVNHFPLNAQALWVGNWVNVVGPYLRSWPHPRALKTHSAISRTLLYRRRVSLSRPFLLWKRPAEVLNNKHIIQRDKENAFSMIQCVVPNQWEHGV